MLNVKNWSPLYKVPMRYGLLSGLLGFGLLITLYYLDHHPFLIPVFFDYRIMLFSIVIFFCLKEIRDYYYQGILAFWQGMISSLVLTFFFAIVSSLLLYGFTQWDPNFVTSYIDLSLVQVKAFSPDDIERIGKGVYEEGIRSLKEADGYFMAKRYFVQSFIISFFISIIISVILRRQPKM